MGGGGGCVFKPLNLFLILLPPLRENGFKTRHPPSTAVLSMRLMSAASARLRRESDSLNFLGHRARVLKCLGVGWFQCGLYSKMKELLALKVLWIFGFPALTRPLAERMRAE